MANIPCPNVIDCPGSDYPLENYSSEAFDTLYFAGRGYTPYNPYQPPPIGNGQFIAHDCDGIAFSVLSQEIADLIAEINAKYCDIPFDGDDDPVDPKEPRFCNSPQTATKRCADGTTISYTAEAGLFCMSTLEAANAYALAYAQQQVATKDCPNPPCSISTSPTLPEGTVGTAYSTQVVGSLGPGAHWYIASGTLPPGLTLNVHTGYITGTPTAAGTAHFTIGTRFP